MMLHTSRAHEHQCRSDTSENIADLGSTGRYDHAPISFRSCRQCDGIALVEACR